MYPSQQFLSGQKFVASRCRIELKFMIVFFECIASKLCKAMPKQIFELVDYFGPLAAAIVFFGGAYIFANLIGGTSHKSTKQVARRVQLAKANSEGFNSRRPTREGFNSRRPTREGFNSRRPTREGFNSRRPTREGSTREGQLAKGSTREGQLAKGSTREGQLAKGSTREGQLAKGSTREGQLAKGSTREGQLAKLHYIFGLFTQFYESKFMDKLLGFRSSFLWSHFDFNFEQLTAKACQSN
uniref:Uncharacterized protein n=1 Tax=Ditylenchus dipsaci TaxID=166011 RepID=A0A915DNS7_9BILA